MKPTTPNSKMPVPRNNGKCYHPDCGGKPIIFCPHGGNHPK